MINRKYKKVYSNRRKYSNSFMGMPPLLSVDDNKPVSYKQQIAVMGIILLICGALFVCVYIFLFLASGQSDGENQTPAQASSASASEKNNGSSENKKAEPPRKQVTKITAANMAVLRDMTTVTMESEDVYKGPLILVNKDYPSRLDGENVELMLDHLTDDYTLSYFTVGFAVDMIDPFNKMMKDFSDQYGDTDILVSCGYRSYETQQELMENEKELNSDDDPESEDTAEKWVAPPGYSEHQTGLALDFDLNLPEGGKIGINYDGNGVYSWLNENCSDYGFIIRYREGKESITGYEYEPWHFRYVGLPHAQYIEDHGITLEEYLDILSDRRDDNAILMQDHDGTYWCIYYVPANSEGSTDIPVPKNYEYTISGDNKVNDNSDSSGGFIVTVKIGDHVEEVPEPSVPESTEESSGEPSDVSEAENIDQQQDSQEQSREDVTIISIPEDAESKSEYIFDPLEGV